MTADTATLVADSAAPEPKGSALDRFLLSPAAGLLARPWFDWVALRALAKLHFPLSRAWAAAAIADGSAERFAAELGVPLKRKVPQRALDRIAALQRDYRAADARWQDAFFGPASVGDLAMVEAHWRKTSHAFMMGRRYFLPLVLSQHVPAVRYEIPAPTRATADHEALLADPRRAFALPSALPKIERSRAIERTHWREYWLRLASPSIGAGTAWAHVIEPLAAAKAPTLVYGHGLCVETEAMDGIQDDLARLARSGIRLIRHHAPGHIRRRPDGFYGGESFLARQPASGLDHFQAAVREMALLVGWAREQGAPRVAVGGISLGALTAQLVAAHATALPQPCRPDVLFLVTTTDRVAALGFASDLARALGLTEALAAAGWDAGKLGRYAPLSDPSLMGPLPPRDVIMVLGRADGVTPFGGGMSLADFWHLPASNVFCYDRGHFSIPVGLYRDRAPLERLALRLAA